MICHEECVEFENPEGFLLRGILHHGNQQVYRNVSLISLNTGLNDMVGWHRLQVKIGRHLAKNGYNVLRFDSFGLGDSEGTIGEGSAVEIFPRIETGLWAQDALCAVNFMGNRFRNEKYIYLGFCGGALTAFHAAAREAKVSGIINVAAPIHLSSPIVANKLDAGNVKIAADIYKRKFFNPNSIKNFFIGRSDYKRVFLTLLYSLKYKIFADPLKKEFEGDNKKAKKHNLNYAFFDSYEKYAKTKRPVLFYYPEFDNATIELKQYFFKKYSVSKFWDNWCDFIEVEKANHIFSSEDSQEMMKTDILKWLERWFVN
jgi:pimeloyl-ACP methyl ester carboxylesterase